MPFNDPTPESLLSRTDSRNPITTCRGITSTGRPCRRGMAPQKPSVVKISHPGLLDATLLYCWQHKDQATKATIESTVLNGPSFSRPAQIRERNSIDSLVARLGVPQTTELPRRPKVPEGKPPRVEQGRPRHHSTNDGTNTANNAYSKPLTEKPHSKPRQPRGLWASLCCMGSSRDDDGHYEPVRHKPRPPPQAHVSGPRPSKTETVYKSSQRPTQPNPAKATLRPNITRPSPADSAVSVPGRKTLNDAPAPQALNKRTVSTPDTRSLLSFIPAHLSPQTTSALLAELSKPISPHDEEGYIYIFWLTDSSVTPPQQDTAASLLSAPRNSKQQRRRRPSDVMSEYAAHPKATDNESNRSGTVKLKIGRANNVHRRMNEWTRQCGYNLSLVRWYPYVSAGDAATAAQSSPSPAPRSSTSLYPDLSQRRRAASEEPMASSPGGSGSGNGVRKVRHAHRVERLVHLELANYRVKENCATCGKEHREWFEIQGTESGVKSVDEVIRRWVRWSETAEKIV
ncbi:hypothetical protein AAFC00_002902 [Neodothiora populina]|uniref:Bacteriophage T5 Orf172 DNA-binding domain-containing protein n=1 Tax=Neodothiora populina TaxID=2781224 RepID=A0ABR3P9V8_9PEZI